MFGFDVDIFVNSAAQVKRLAERHTKLVFDQCRFGLVSLQDGIPVQKSTVFLTNCPAIVEEFQNVRCLGNHKHCPIEGCEGGVSRSKAAQIYPKDLCEAISKAVLKQAERDGFGQ